MTADESETLDAFLGGRLILAQPQRGYRAATDPVLLAASAPARTGETVLELGIGTGAAALCLCARVGGLIVTGLELRADHAALARANAKRNGFEIEVVQGDVTDMPSVLKARSFDHVIMNPPFHDNQNLASPCAGRDAAHREHDATTVDWVSAALSRLKPKGCLTLIQRCERLPDILSAIGDRAGNITVLPLAARPGRPSKRFLLRARKGARAPFRLLAPLVLHQGDTHVADRDDFTAPVRAILRDGAALSFEDPI